MKIIKNLMLFLLALLPVAAHAQFDGNVLKCNDETFGKLKAMSSSRLSGGDIMLFTTTHQDLGWLNNIEACVIDRDTLWLTPFLQRLEDDPTFRMDIEQSSILFEYLHRHPDKKELINNYMKEGRICVGGTYIQPYEEMYSGESLARQFYFGTRWLKNTFDGYTTSSYFNVDVPGRTLQMPQIMKKAGVENLIISRHGRGLFYWQAPDGSKVRTYTPGHYIFFYDMMGKPDSTIVSMLADESVLWQEKYNDRLKKGGVMPAMLNYEFIWNMAPVENTPVFKEKWNAVEYIENTETGERIKVNLPKFRYSIADEFFSELDKSTKSLPVISGERPDVWLYIHGPSHERAITASREGDRLLPQAEMLSSYVSMIYGDFNRYPESELNSAWMNKIYPDHGWGGNGGEITDNIFRRKLESSVTAASSILTEQGMYLASMVNADNSKGRPAIVFNNLSYERDAPVTVKTRFPEGTASVSVLSSGGQNVESQLKVLSRHADGSVKEAEVVFVAASLPPMGYETYYIDGKSVKPSESAAGEETIDTDFYRIELSDGCLESIFDKELGREIIDNRTLKAGEVFTMRSVGNGAGEFDAVQQPDMEGFDRTSGKGIAWEKVEDGPVYVTYKTRIPVKHAVVEQHMKVFRHMKRIEFEVSLLNWEAKLYREFRLAFPMAEGFSTVRYEVPYATLQVGRDEMPGAAGERYYVENSELHPRGIGNWISASDGECAVTISSSVAVVDYMDPTDKDNSQTIIQPVLLASRKSCHWLGNEYLQPGDHHYRFVLTSHRDVPGAAEENGVSGNFWPVVVKDFMESAEASLPERHSFLSVDNPSLKITALKKCEDDDTFIVRVCNMTGEEAVSGINFNGKDISIIRTNLIEEEQEKAGKLVVGPYAIETYKIVPKNEIHRK